MMVNRAFESHNLTYRVKLPGGQERLRELILYVAKRAQSMARFGLIKLNKIIWRADFTAFAERGIPITGRAYQRLRLGPAPEEMRPLLEEMEQAGEIKLERLPITSFENGNEIVEYRPQPIVEPSMRWFSPDDLLYVDQAIAYYYELTGMETSDDSHGVAWRTRSDGEPMPYESALLSDEPVSERQLKRVAKMGAERGWRSS